MTFGRAYHVQVVRTVDAPIHTAMRADELLEHGDLDGQEVWKTIIDVLDELLSEKVPDNAMVN